MTERILRIWCRFVRNAKDKSGKCRLVRILETDTRSMTKEAINKKVGDKLPNILVSNYFCSMDVYENMTIFKINVCIHTT